MVQNITETVSQTHRFLTCLSRTILGVCLISSCLSTASAQTYEIYENNKYGIQNALPSQTIEVKRDKVEVYNHDKYGLRDPFPDVEIRKQPSYDNFKKDYTGSTTVQPILPQPNSRRQQILRDFAAR